MTEAGGGFSYADGKPVFYNQGDVKKWGCIMATNGHAHQVLCDQATAILAEIDREN